MLILLDVISFLYLLYLSLLAIDCYACIGYNELQYLCEIILT